MAQAQGVDTIAAEIAAHHDRLVEWLSDSSDREALEAFRSAHTADFSLVTVDGEVVPGQAVLDGLASAGGTRPGLQITVSDVTVVDRSVGSVLVRFVEQHHVDGSPDAERIVTALLRVDAAGSAGLRWHHVHETRR
ncbi:hypothetical protein FFT09_16105 [Saccharomonospora piscinae]|uniref:hypothetical protein n=1 Tax=Saccharomonospora piscinae TaxID=687388 RepID=UPI0011060654|nr:hypothetical protein [Saccharomonospora piscinae]TLW92366.1 hypothetical protein FFT09_16105 [Saccharomonospora piscinae]